MPIRRSQKKRNAELQQKQNHRRFVIDPMVNTGNSAHRHQARSKADPTRPHHRMVTLAQSSPGDRSACAPQSKTATVMLVRREPRESEIAVVRAASQRLCPFQVDSSRCIGVEIKPTNVRQDFFISMASREFAKAASFVVDAEFKVVTRARLDEIVDEIFRKLFLMAFCSLLAQQGLIL